MKILSRVIVYVNVTSFAWAGELFMWMLHHCFECLTHENIEWNNCLCECYIVCVNVTIQSGMIVYVNVTSFAWAGELVYVNVTSLFWVLDTWKYWVE
jgi:hypothetical protein